MILNQINDVEISSESTEKLDFGLDMESLGIVLKGFSDNLYSNKIGTIVREITSNCFDAHQELGITKNVVISIKPFDTFTREQGSISFRDFGIGLSPERVRNIYSQYFASTKRKSNDEIGGFGIGAKSPLSYTDLFDVVTIVDGIKYHYIVHRGEKVPRLELISKEHTNEERGTDIIIPIKNLVDESRFKEELKNQLQFFDNITFIGADIDNEYTIIKGKHFIARIGKEGEAAAEEMKLCIGKVGYPIDYEQVDFAGHSKYAFSHSQVHMRVDIGDVPVTMTRESVEYSEGVQKFLKEKYEDMIQEFAQFQENACKSAENVLEYMIACQQKNAIEVAGYTLQLPRGISSQITSKNKYRWTFKGLEDLDGVISNDPHFWNHILTVRAQVDSGSIIKAERKLKAASEYVRKWDKLAVFRIKQAISAKKMAYVIEKHGYNFVLLSLRDLEPSYRFVLEEYRIINHKAECSNQEKWDLFIKLRNECLKLLLKNSTSYDRIEIDPDWNRNYLDSRKSGIHKSKEEFTIRWRNGSYSYFKDNTRVDRFYREINQDALAIYCFQGEEEAMESTLLLLRNLPIEYTFKIARGNVKHLAGMNKCYHVDEVPEELIRRSKLLEFAKRLPVSDEQIDFSMVNDVRLNIAFHSLLRPSVLEILTSNEMFGMLNAMDGSWFTIKKLVENPLLKVEESDHPWAVSIWSIRHGIDLVDFCRKITEFLEESDNLLYQSLIRINTAFEGREEIKQMFIQMIKQNFKTFKYNPYV